MGHRDVKTTLTVYAHLINTDDHTGNMAALGAVASTPKTTYGNVIPLHGWVGRSRRLTAVQAYQRHDPSEKNGE